jgi:hypothetical protein
MVACCRLHLRDFKLLVSLLWSVVNVPKVGDFHAWNFASHFPQNLFALYIYNYKTPLTNVHSQYSVAAGLICVGARATSQQARAKAKRT